MLPILWWIIGIVALVIIIFIYYYNRLATLSNRIDNSLSQIDVQLKRRADLVPNLIATVKGYAKHESGIMKAVADARKLPQPKVADIAQGRVWSGQSAQKLGLVDELGGLDDAIAAAAIAAKLGEDWRVEEYPKARTLEEKILQRLLGAQATEPTPPDVLTQQWERLQEDLSLLQDLNDPKGLYSRLPQLLRLE